MLRGKIATLKLQENVEGQRCDQCQAGYYNLTAESGCLGKCLVTR